jgi:hypothetical protein
MTHTTTLSSRPVPRHRLAIAFVYGFCSLGLPGGGNPARAETAEFRRGDANGDGTFDLADSVSVLACLFLGHSCSTCPDAADANDDGTLDIGDGVFGLSYLFLGGAAPPAPGPFACGRDGTLDGLQACEQVACARPDDPGAGCARASGTYDVHIARVRVLGQFLLDGTPFPDAFTQGANFFLREPGTGVEVYLGLSNDRSFDRWIIPGRYDVLYRHKLGDAIPRNPEAVILRDVEIRGDITLDVDVPSISIHGAFSLAGAPFPESVYENGLVSMRDRSSGVFVPLAESHAQAYAATLVPGTYDLAFTRKAGASIVPWNDLGIFRREFDVSESGSLDIDVPKVHVSGSIRINGDTPPQSAYENGRLFLSDPETGTETYLGQTRYNAYEALVLPGVYDIVYKREAGGSIVPINSRAVVASGVKLQSDSVVPIDLRAHEVSGAITINGSAPPDSAYENGWIRLHHGSDAMIIGQTRYGAYVARVLPGTYEIRYERAAGGSIVPHNRSTLLGSMKVAGGLTRDIDVPTVDLEVRVRLNGKPFPPQKNESAKLFLEDVKTGDLVYVGPIPSAVDLPVKVVPGEYRFRYSHESGIQLPRNSLAIIGGVITATRPASLTADIRAVDLSGDFLLDGPGEIPDARQVATLLLRSDDPSDTVLLGGLPSRDYAVRVVPGRYDVLYDWAKGAEIPRNDGTVIGCVEVGVK